MKRTSFLLLAALGGNLYAQQSMMPMPDGTMMQMPASSQKSVSQEHAAQATVHSYEHDTYALQEPENPEQHTGNASPAPELLASVVKQTPMSVDDFYGLALKHNPTILQAQQEVRRSQALAKQAALLPNPGIGYSGEHIRGGSYGGGEQGAYVSQDFVLGGKLGLRKTIYQQQAAEDSIGVEQQQLRVKNDIGQAYYRTLTAQAMVVVRQRLLHVALDAVSTAHQLMNLGQADAPDVLQSEVEAEQAKMDFVRAQREFLQQFHILAAYAGVASLPACPLVGDITSPAVLDTDAAVKQALSSSPAVLKAQQHVNVAQAKWKDAKREVVPDLTVKAGEWYSGDAVNGEGKAAGPMSFVDAGVKLPLFNRNQGNVEAAKVEVEQAHAETDRIQLQLQRDAEPLVQSYKIASFEVDRYQKELLPRARRAYELYLMKYQQMAGAYPQVLVSQRTLFQLQVDYLRALGEMWSTSMALQNGVLQGGLDDPRANTGGGNAAEASGRPY